MADKLSYYTKVKDKGFWRYSLKYTFIITLLIEAILYVHLGTPRMLLAFLNIFSIIFPLISLTWIIILSKFDFYNNSPGKTIKGKIPVQSFIYLCIAVAITIASLIFPKQFEELNQKIASYKNDKIIEKIDLQYSLEPVETKLEFSSNIITLTTPKAYLIFKSHYKKEGIFSDILAASRIHLSAQFPDLEPWKLSKNILEYLQQRNKMLKQSHNSESEITKILKEDPNFISINLIENFSPSGNDSIVSESNMLRDMARSQEKVTSEDKYGLRITNTRFPIRITLPDGQHATSYQNGTVVKPLSEEYPSMKFACDSICTIITNYKNNISISVSFNVSKLESWQDIWKKANSKVDSMIKWD